MIHQIQLYKFPDNKLYFAINDSSKAIAYFLLRENIPLFEVINYIIDKTTDINGKTTLFSNGLVLIRMYHYEETVRQIAILVHEITHAAKRIVKKDEEAEAYMADYIFEEIMKRLEPDIDYTSEPRDWKWLDEMTH